MAREPLNLGTVANDGTGDELRPAMQKVDNNFAEIYTVFGDGSNLTNALNIQGSPVGGNVTYWDSATGITGTTDITWDSVNQRLQLQGATPSFRMLDTGTSGSHDVLSDNEVLRISADPDNGEPDSEIEFWVDGLEVACIDADGLRVEHPIAAEISINDDNGDVLTGELNTRLIFEGNNSSAGEIGYLNTTSGQLTIRNRVAGDIRFRMEGIAIDQFRFEEDSGNVRVATIESEGMVIGPGTSASVGLEVQFTDAILLPVGTDAQRPTGVPGLIRYNSDSSEFEGYSTAWSALGGGGPTARVINIQTGTSYNVKLTDLGATIVGDNAALNRIEILPEATTAYPDGFWFEIIQLGAGTTRVEVGDFVQLNGVSGAPSSTGADIIAQFGLIRLTKIGSDQWIVSGDNNAVT